MCIVIDPEILQTHGQIGPNTSYNTCCAVIEDFPDVESPEVYGPCGSQAAEMSYSQSKHLQFLLHALEFPAQYHGSVA